MDPPSYPFLRSSEPVYCLPCNSSMHAKAGILLSKYHLLISHFSTSYVAFFLCFHLFDHTPRMSVCSRLEIIGQGVEGLVDVRVEHEKKTKGSGDSVFSLLLRDVKYA